MVQPIVCYENKTAACGGSCSQVVLRTFAGMRCWTGPSCLQGCSQAASQRAPSSGLSQPWDKQCHGEPRAAGARPGTCAHGHHLGGGRAKAGSGAFLSRSGYLLSQFYKLLVYNYSQKKQGVVTQKWDQIKGGLCSEESTEGWQKEIFWKKNHSSWSAMSFMCRTSQSLKHLYL